MWVLIIVVLFLIVLMVIGIILYSKTKNWILDEDLDITDFS